MKTLADYEADIDAIARTWLADASKRIEAGWAPDFAFATVADYVARPDSADEATIAMMTQAAASMAGSEWPHRDAFIAWWNKRFAGAPLTSGFATPCIVEFGGKTGNVIATWAVFTKEWATERVDA